MNDRSRNLISTFACSAVISLAMPGCQSDEGDAAPAEPSFEEAEAEEHIQTKAEAPINDRDINAAQSRLNTAEERVTGIRVQIKRFLTTTPIETMQQETSEAALQVQQLVLEKRALDKSYNSLQATYEQYLGRQQEGNFDPSDEERSLIESSQEIVDIKHLLRELRLEEAALLVDHKEDSVEVHKVRAKLLVLKHEHSDEFDRQARTLFNARLEQAATGVQSLQTELARVTEALEMWTIRRQNNLQIMTEYQTLQRELKQAEEERALAQRAIADLLEANSQ